MSGVEVALLIVLSVSVIALIVTLIVVLKRLDAVSKETIQFLQVTREELASTLQEIRKTSENISQLASEATCAVTHVDKAIEAVGKFEPGEVVASVASKVGQGIAVGASSLYSGIKEAIRAYRGIPEKPE